MIETEGLKKYFPAGEVLFRRSKNWVRAVDGVDLLIKDEETLGLVGESGCGKSTFGRLIMRLLEPTVGTIRYMSRNIWEFSKIELKKFRRETQIIFQDPFSTLNPRKSTYEILSLPYKIHGMCEKDKIKSNVLNLLRSMGLTPPEQFINKYPHEFSEGQRQRVGIARAIAIHPRFIVADEPVSNLDLATKAEILLLLRRLKETFKLSCLFITHDLAVIRCISDRVAVMYLGRIVELAEVKELFDNPCHPYTKALISATPVPNPRLSRARQRILLIGDLPSPIHPPAGCRFHTRCAERLSNCSSAEPEMIDIGNNHFVACNRYL